MNYVGNNTAWDLDLILLSSIQFIINFPIVRPVLNFFFQIEKCNAELQQLLHVICHLDNGEEPAAVGLRGK